MNLLGNLNSMNKIFIFIFTLIVSVHGESILDFLDISTSHKHSSINGIDAVFLINMQNHIEDENLKRFFQHYEIPFTVFNNFEKLSLSVMKKYCSRTMSPYLLTQILSHLSLYKYCLQCGISKVLIVENQSLGVSDPHKLAYLLSQIPVRHWDVFYTDVHYHHPNTGEFIEPKLAHFPKNRLILTQDIARVFCRYGMSAYVIHREGMRKILRYYRTHWDDLPFDQSIAKISSLRKFGTNYDIITNPHKTQAPQKVEVKVPKKNENRYPIRSSHWIDPIELLVPDRIDIIPKYTYAKYSSNGYQTDWHLNLYRSHLENWCQFYNSKPLKVGFNDYKAAFDNLIKSIQTQNFDPSYTIEMSVCGVPWNGAHRIGTCIALKKLIHVTVQVQRPSQNLTLQVFADKYKLEEKYLDYIAHEYAQLNKKTYIACLFPIAYDKHDEVEQIMQQHGIIVYKKDFYLTESGALEFIKTVYTGEWWIGSYKDDFKHSRGKVLLTFPDAVRKKFPVRVYLYESDSTENVIAAKEKIRNLCNLGNDVFHVNDTHEQTKIIASTVFNKNSMHFLNHRKLVECSNFERLFSGLKKFVEKYSLNPESLCIDAEAVKSVFGIQDCFKLGLFHKNPLPIDYKDYGIASHSKFCHVYNKTLDDLIFNPDNYFYYQGFKFLCQQLVEE